MSGRNIGTASLVDRHRARGEKVGNGAVPEPPVPRLAEAGREAVAGRRPFPARPPPPSAPGREPRILGWLSRRGRPILRDGRRDGALVEELAQRHLDGPHPCFAWHDPDWVIRLTGSDCRG